MKDPDCSCLYDHKGERIAFDQLCKVHGRKPTQDEIDEARKQIVQVPEKKT